MKKSYLQEVIKKRCHRINNHCEKIPGHFAADDIHDLRVDYKKLRAFIRMLQLDRDVSKHLDLPGDLKEIYQAAAPIRDLQLFIPLIKEKLPGLVQYVNEREKELFVSKEELVGAIESVALKKAEHNISRHLPRELHDETIRKFVHKQISGIQIILLAIEDDEHLHSIRKHLKDLIYNIRVFEEEWGIKFPSPAWKSEKTLNETATALGDYNDECIALYYLSDRFLHHLPENEKEMLARLKQRWTREKEIHKQELIERLRKLKLVSDF